MNDSGHRLAVELQQFRLVVQQIEGRRPSVLKQEDDPLGLRSEMRQPLGQRLQRVDRRVLRRRGPQFLGQQCAQRDARKAAAGLGEENHDVIEESCWDHRLRLSSRV